MNRLIILALIVCSSMMATACKGSKSEASNAVSEQPQQAVNLAEVPFLKAMGLDVSKVAIGTEYDTKIFATDAGQGKEVRLTDKQVKQLLGGVPLIDLGEGSAPFVVGAKAFADNVMLVFWHEVGDGHELILATYNVEKGDLRDIATTPSWQTKGTVLLQSFLSLSHSSSHERALALTSPPPIFCSLPSIQSPQSPPSHPKKRNIPYWYCPL